MSRKRQNNAVRWRRSEASFNNNSLFEQAISMKSGLENLGTSILTQRVISIGLKWNSIRKNPRYMRSRVVYSFIEHLRCQSPHQKQMTCSFSRSKTHQIHLPSPFQAMLVYNQLILLMRNSFWIFLKLLCFRKYGREIIMNLWRVRHRNR